MVIPQRSAWKVHEEWRSQKWFKTHNVCSVAPLSLHRRLEHPDHHLLVTEGWRSKSQRAVQLAAYISSVDFENRSKLTVVDIVFRGILIRITVLQ